GCLVENVKNINHWIGDEQEIKFYIFLLENEVVNITITYLSTEKDDYVSYFYFSSSKSSKRIETKNGEEQYIKPLKAVKKNNDWVEFILSTEEGILEVQHEPNTIEQLPLNRTSNLIKDLIIRGSNISFCKE
ncbi:unnamed protein product, partial [Meganyctiphanes norvegica]